MTALCLVSRQPDCRHLFDETAEESKQASCYDTSQLTGMTLPINSSTAVGDNSTRSTYPSLTQVTVMPSVQKLCEASYRLSAAWNTELCTASKTSLNSSRTQKLRKTQQAPAQVPALAWLSSSSSAVKASRELAIVKDRFACKLLFGPLAGRP